MGANICTIPVFVADDVVGVVVADAAPVAGDHRTAGAEAFAVAGAGFVVELVFVGDFEGERASGLGGGDAFVEDADEFVRVGGVGGVALLLELAGGFLAGGGVVDAFVTFVVLVPAVDEVDDAGLDVGEVDEGIADGDPGVVDVFLGFGGGAAAF